MANPYFRFYIKDWRSELSVYQLSDAAYKVWHEMILDMYEATPIGFFVGPYGEPINLAEFAQRINMKPASVRKAIAEIQERNVCGVDESGRIYSRRILKNVARSNQAIEDGKRGGNPALLTHRPLTPDITEPLTLGDKPHLNHVNHVTTISDSLRSSALGFGSWPEDVDMLKGLALVFVGAFANCRDPIRAEKHTPHYTALLAQMRSRGITIAQAWSCCEQALKANSRPLFGAAIKIALSFVPPPTKKTQRTVAGGQVIAEFLASLSASERGQ